MVLLGFKVVFHISLSVASIFVAAFVFVGGAVEPVGLISPVCEMFHHDVLQNNISTMTKI